MIYLIFSKGGEGDTFHEFTTRENYPPLLGGLWGIVSTSNKGIECIKNKCNFNIDKSEF